MLYPTVEAIKTGSKRFYFKVAHVKNLVLKMAPPKGALKIEPIPAPIPTATAILLSFKLR